MKIAIAGYGIEGEANYSYWTARPNSDVTIVDEADVPAHSLPVGAKTLLGKGVFGQLDDFDIVVRTAGLAPRKIVTNGLVWSGTNEFFDKCPAPIIGVTGSKGKGTTASLIASILKAAGRKVWLLGNIGQPALDCLAQIQADDIVVYELSSFQLWDLEQSPQTAVVLYIEREHLDVHADMAEYVAAKANITRHQTPDDILIYNRENEYAQSIAALSTAIKVGYPSKLTAHIENDIFYNGEQEICSVSVLKIRGEHNQTNAIAAIDAVWKYTQDSAVIAAGLAAFTGLAHRLSFVGSHSGVSYYDDSIATTPSSAIAALKSFDGPKVIILGGSSKGSDFSELAEELIYHDATVLLIGDEAETIAAACQNAGFDDIEIIHNATMAAVVRRASELASVGSIVLLSPAAASFGLFKNYADRGDQFIAAVNALA